MFTITQDEFDDIMGILAEHCVHECPRIKGIPCRMTNCDIDKIYDILHSHLENNFSGEDDFPEEDDFPF